ncbi:hypothetical protein hairong_092 [Pseudomonas phage hairong]|nr:hypothetical protein hairong_092 [Pseudomonas phage hairong]
MTDQPTVEEELLRKSGEALSWLANERERGSITKEAYIAALQAFDMICLGLVPTEYSDWAKGERDKASIEIPDSVLMRKLNRLVRVSLRRKMGEIKITTIDPDKGAHHKFMQFEDEIDPIKAACKRYPKVIDKLLDAGFRQVVE